MLPVYNIKRAIKFARNVHICLRVSPISVPRHRTLGRHNGTSRRKRVAARGKPKYHLIFRPFRVNLTVNSRPGRLCIRLWITTDVHYGMWRGIGACIVHRVVYVRALTLRTRESLLAPTTCTALLARHRLLLTACTKLPTKRRRRAAAAVAATVTSKDNLDNFADLSLASRNPGVYIHIGDSRTVSPRFVD